MYVFDKYISIYIYICMYVYIYIYIYIYVCLTVFFTKSFQATALRRSAKPDPKCHQLHPRTLPNVADDRRPTETLAARSAPTLEKFCKRNLNNNATLSFEASHHSENAGSRSDSSDRNMLIWNTTRYVRYVLSSQKLN